ncbi:DUF4249 domain-containing protein [Flavobacterium sp.]|uniref:DUF4249 domain-containing protein n=1 Tax=Flavobacterium sp. TaxID=239 RepID=UPI000ED15291|nr:DUF4249 domain-containing protein [Flavobacterium sp.]HCQ12339.1 DUF4249 domain-containing protein [Flavobacterium sp.]
MKKATHFKYLFIGLFFSLISCVDPYQLQTSNFEEAIVIEATITNELKKQEVLISKTYRLEENEPILVSNASVTVSDNLGNQYNFEEADGKYISTTEFRAENDRQYKLNITTSDGKSYSSTTQKLTAVNELENITATVITNLEGQRGVEIAANSFDPTNSSKYYRFEFYETSKATAPKWRDLYAVVNPDLTDSVGHEYIELFPRVTEAQVCYLTEKNKKIVLTSTNFLNEDRISNFPVHFLNDFDYKIGERYSIEVRQIIQNLESYTYYKTLQELSVTGESILSQNQPGFLVGNIKSDDNPKEKVIGFFEVASVSSKRIFFNYEDLFPGEEKPPYLEDCTELEYTYCFLPFPECDGRQLNGNVKAQILVYYEHEQLEPEDDPFNLIYTYVRAKCGDCTSFSSNIRPDFWID